MLKSPAPFPWDRFNDMTMAQRVQLLAERSETHEERHGDLLTTVHTFVIGFDKVGKLVETLIERQEEAAERASNEKQEERKDRARWAKRSISVLAAVGLTLVALLGIEASNHGEWSTGNLASACVGVMFLSAALVFVWVTA